MWACGVLLGLSRLLAFHMLMEDMNRAGLMFANLLQDLIVRFHR